MAIERALGKLRENVQPAVTVDGNSVRTGRRPLRDKGVHGNVVQAAMVQQRIVGATFPSLNEKFLIIIVHFPDILLTRHARIGQREHPVSPTIGEQFVVGIPMPFYPSLRLRIDRPVNVVARRKVCRLPWPERFQAASRRPCVPVEIFIVVLPQFDEFFVDEFLLLGRVVAHLIFQNSGSF